MAAVILTPSDLQRLKADPRFSAAHAVLLDVMIAQGEVIFETTPTGTTQ